MEYKVLSGPFNAGKLERDLDGHAAEGGAGGRHVSGHQLDEAENPDGDRA
jgi:hypothetical protein